MSEMRYLGKLARPGDHLEWDGLKLVPSTALVRDGSGHLRLQGHHLDADGGPLLVPGEGVGIERLASGAYAVSNTSSSTLWRWNEADASQLLPIYNTLGDLQMEALEAPWGSVLRLRLTRAEAGSVPGFLILHLRDFVPRAECHRYRLKFRISGFSGSPKSIFGIGAAFLSNGAQADGLECEGSLAGVSRPGGRALRVSGGRVTVGGHAGPGPSLELVPLIGRPAIDLEHEVRCLRREASVGFQCRLSSGMGFHLSDDERASRELGVSRRPPGDLGSGAGIIVACEPVIMRATLDLDLIRVVRHEMDD